MDKIKKIIPGCVFFFSGLALVVYILTDILLIQVLLVTFILSLLLWFVWWKKSSLDKRRIFVVRLWARIK